jgi:hypothetical protein
MIALLVRMLQNLYICVTLNYSLGRKYRIHWFEVRHQTSVYFDAKEVCVTYNKDNEFARYY